MTASPRTFACPPFPDLVLDDDSGYWQGDIALEQQTVAVSIYVDASLSDETLATAAWQLASLARLRKLGIAAIGGQTEEETVRYFFEFHREELPKIASPSATADELVQLLGLVGVGIHKDDEPYSLVLDFSFGREHSDELLAVKFSPSSEVVSVSHES